MKVSHIFGIITAVALIVLGLTYPVPEKHIYVSSSNSAYYSTWDENQGAEYIGGDAYNYQIEASLKAGYMSGILVMKSVAFVGGVFLLFSALFSHAKLVSLKKQEILLDRMNSSLSTEVQILNQISKTFNERSYIDE